MGGQMWGFYILGHQSPSTGQTALEDPIDCPFLVAIISKFEVALDTGELRMGPVNQLLVWGGKYGDFIFIGPHPPSSG